MVDPTDSLYTLVSVLWANDILGNAADMKCMMTRISWKLDFISWIKEIPEGELMTDCLIVTSSTPKRVYTILLTPT